MTTPSKPFHGLGAALAAAAALAVAVPTAAEELPPAPLVLGEGRFAVTATFQVPGGPVSPAFPGALTRDSGTFWFFDDDNIELVVKVLDACGVDGHFWVFAAGLTNVGVDLVIEDRLAEVLWFHSHPPGPPFPPIQDTAAFSTCFLPDGCGQGTGAEIAATPREDEEAELVALFVGGGLTAPQGLYERVRDDLAALRTDHPELADVHFIPRHDARTLLLTLPPVIIDAILDETYHEWDCLNTWYGAVAADAFSFDTARVTFAGILDTERIAAEYELVIGGGEVEPNPVARADHGTEYLCALGQGETLHWFAELGPEGERSVLHFTSQPGASPQPAGSWSPATPQPEPPWLPLFEQCVELYVAECCALS